MQTTASAQELRPNVIQYHTQEWKGVTNRDGTGLYHDLMKAIFTEQGIKVETSYFPFKRALLNVEKGSADISGGTEKNSPNFIHSRYPAWVVRSSAMFDKKYLPDWKGLETIRNHIDKTVTPPVIGEEYGIPLHEVRTRYAAIRMVVRGKMRYYLDDYTILEDLMHEKRRGLAFEEGKKTCALAEWTGPVLLFRNYLNVNGVWFFPTRNEAEEFGKYLTLALKNFLKAASFANYMPSGGF